MTNPQQLTYSYYALALCVATSSIPLMVFQTFTMFFSLAMIIGFYVLRKKWNKETFEHKEASSIIKTFWVWATIYAVGFFVAGGLISKFGDTSAMDEWTRSVIEGTAMPDREAMEQVAQQSMDTNFNLIIMMVTLCIIPAQIYAVVKIKQGLARLKNQATTPPEALIG